MANATQSDVLGKFVWYDQMSNDLPGAEKFYSKVVGWSLAPNTMNAQKYTLLKSGETMVGGLMPIPEDAAKMGVRPAWMGYIAVDDVKKYADKVKAAGGAIHRAADRNPQCRDLRRRRRSERRGIPACSRAMAMRRRCRIPRSPAISAGTSCTAAIRRSPSPSTPACSAGPRARRWRWAPMGTYQIFNTKGQQAGGMMKKMAQEPAAHWLYYITVDAIDAGPGSGEIRGRPGDQRADAGSGRKLDHQRHRSAGRDVRAGCAKEIGRIRPLLVRAVARGGVGARSDFGGSHGADMSTRRLFSWSGDQTDERSNSDP